jgi:septal ring factor EnvC (AmiA/AmiB activator)
LARLWRQSLRQIAIALVLPSIFAAEVRAQSVPSSLAPDEEAADPRERLEMLRRQLEEDRARQLRLEAQSAALAKENTRLQAALIGAAAKVKARERELSVTETELSELEVREGAAALAFNEGRDKLAGLLAVLQRMGREPPPALIVRPENAAMAARSAMVLTAVIPGVRAQATKLAANLSTLKALRHAAAGKRVTLSAAAEALNREQSQTAALLKEKLALSQKTAKEQHEATRKVTKLGAEAANLHSLIRRIGGDIAELPQAGFADANFLAKKGRLAWPANGRMAAQFGEDDGLGGHRTGILLETRPKAQVTSPVDGKIVYAGTFLGYGQLLIIAAGGGYHVLLSGLAQIDGNVGQVLLAGEPVGQMGTVNLAESRNGVFLGIEIRRETEPVDPTQWFLRNETNANGKGQG